MPIKYKVNSPILVRYFAYNYQQGLNDLQFTLTSPDGIDLTSNIMTEIEPGLYQTTFTPTFSGIWWTRVFSPSAPKNLFSDEYIVEGVSQDNIFYLEDLSEKSTTSNNLINATTQFLNPAEGEYLIQWYFEITGNWAGANYLYEVTLNNTSLVKVRNAAGAQYSDNGWTAISGFTKKYLMNQSNNIAVNFAGVWSTVYIKNIRFYIYRIIK